MYLQLITREMRGQSDLAQKVSNYPDKGEPGSVKAVIPSVSTVCANVSLQKARVGNFHSRTTPLACGTRGASS